MKFKLLTLVCTLLLLGCPPSDVRSLPGNGLLSTPSVAALESGIVVAVVLDTSGSMDGSRIATVKDIVKNNIAPKLQYYQARGNKLEVCLIECGGDARLIIGTSDYEHSEFLAQTEAFRAGGGTPLGEAVHAAFVQLASSNKEEQHIFVLTDGEATGIHPAEVLAAATNQRVSLHLVGFQSSQAYYQAFQDHGAQILMAENPEQLNATCDTIFKGILKVEAE